LRSNPNRDGIPPAFSNSPVTKQHYLKKQLAFAKGTHPPSHLKLQRGIVRKRARRKRIYYPAGRGKALAVKLAFVHYSFLLYDLVLIVFKERLY
jgi:hypothetical protein